MAQHHYSFPVVTGIDRAIPSPRAGSAWTSTSASIERARFHRPALLRPDLRDRSDRPRRCARVDAGAGRRHPGAFRRRSVPGALSALQGAHRGMAAAVSANCRGGSALRQQVVLEMAPAPAARSHPSDGNLAARYDGCAGLRPARRKPRPIAGGSEARSAHARTRKATQAQNRQQAPRKRQGRKENIRRGTHEAGSQACNKPDASQLRRAVRAR